jgi:hypothetical protein
MFKGSAWETGRVDLRAAGLPFKVKKHHQLFIRSRNEALTLAMRVNNPDRSSPTINRRVAGETPSQKMDAKKSKKEEWVHDSWD